MSPYYKITTPRNARAGQNFKVRITTAGTEFFAGADYDDRDLEELLYACGDNVHIKPVPRSRGVVARMEGTRETIDQTLAKAVQDSFPFYAGGFSEPILR